MIHKSSWHIYSPIYKTRKHQALGASLMAVMKTKAYRLLPMSTLNLIPQLSILYSQVL